MGQHSRITTILEKIDRKKLTHLIKGMAMATYKPSNTRLSLDESVAVYLELRAINFIYCNSQLLVKASTIDALITLWLTEIQHVKNRISKCHEADFQNMAPSLQQQIIDLEEGLVKNTDFEKVNELLLVGFALAPYVMKKYEDQNEHVPGSAIIHTGELRETLTPLCSLQKNFRKNRQ